MKAITVSTLLALMFSLTGYAGDLVHIPSGVTFPSKIMRFTLIRADEGTANSEKIDFYYLNPDELIGTIRLSQLINKK